MIINIDTRTRAVRICAEHRIDNNAEFESKHPRDKNGKFTSGGRTSTADPDYRPGVPHGAIAAQVDLDNLVPQLATHIENAIQDNMKLYPFMKDHFSFIGTTNSPLAKGLGDSIDEEDNIDGFYKAEPAGGRGRICFSELGLILAELRPDTSDHHPVGTNSAKGIVDHEFGHGIWYQLGLEKNTNSPLSKFINDYMSTHTKTDIRKNLSNYANTGPGEFFAEAFAELRNNPKPRPLARKIGQLLDDEIKRQKLNNGG